MKRFLLLLVSLFFFSEVGVTQNYQVGDSLYVWAVSGLSMRTTPDLKGKRIMTIPFGKKVKIERFYGKELTLQIIKPRKFHKQNHSGFKMTGQWSKISFMDSVGYVFNGYLSQFPVVNLGLKETENGDQVLYSKEGFSEWVKRNFGLLNTITKYDSLYDYRIERNIYSNGIIIENAAGKCSDQTIIIPSTSYNETFLIFNLLWQLDQNNELENPDGFIISEQDQGGFSGFELMCDFKVKHQLGVAVIAISCCC